MLELKAKIRRNEERLASEVAPPISLEDQVGKRYPHKIQPCCLVKHNSEHQHAHGSTCSWICAVHVQKQLDDMAAELQEMLTRSEVLGEEGDVDGSQAAATQAEAIKAGQAPA